MGLKNLHISLDNSILDRNDPTGNIRLYLQEMGKQSVLTPEEERELGVRILDGDQQAIDSLIKANLRFVVSIAKQYQHKGLGLSELINAGNIGLTEAAKLFDITKGYRFISYAVKAIRGSMVEALGESHLVTLPLRSQHIANKISDIMLKFLQENEREPDADEISEIINNNPKLLGVNFDQEISALDIQKIISAQAHHTSIDSPLGDEIDGDTYGALISHEDSHEIKDELFSNLQNEDYITKVKMLLPYLTEKEATVLKYFFGIEHDKEYTMKEIGVILDYDPERIRQLKQDALKKLTEHTWIWRDELPPTTVGEFIEKKRGKQKTVKKVIKEAKKELTSVIDEELKSEENDSLQLDETTPEWSRRKKLVGYHITRMDLTPDEVQMAFHFFIEPDKEVKKAMNVYEKYKEWALEIAEYVQRELKGKGIIAKRGKYALEATNESFVSLLQQHASFLHMQHDETTAIVGKPNEEKILTPLKPKEQLDKNFDGYFLIESSILPKIAQKPAWHVKLPTYSHNKILQTLAAFMLYSLRKAKSSEIVAVSVKTLSEFMGKVGKRGTSEEILEYLRTIGYSNDLYKPGITSASEKIMKIFEIYTGSSDEESLIVFSFNDRLTSKLNDVSTFAIEQYKAKPTGIYGQLLLQTLEKNTDDEQRYYTWKELQKLLSVVNPKYTKNAGTMKAVVEIATKDINKNTSYEINYEYKWHTGSSEMLFSFTIRRKDDSQVQESVA